VNLLRSTASLAGLTAIGLVGVVVLLALGKNVPEVLSLVVTTGLGGVAGAALPVAAPKAPTETLGRPLPTPTPVTNGGPENVSDAGSAP
jgi:hypothetical protein